MANKKKKSSSSNAGSPPANIGVSKSGDGQSQGTSIPPLPFNQPPPPPLSYNKPALDHPDASLNATYFKIQTLPDNLRQFLDHDYEGKKETYKCMEYYRILAHFDPETKSRPNHKKEKLIGNFMKHVFPLIKTYQHPSPPTPMQAEPSTRQDFNPLSRKTLREDLFRTIWEVDPSVVIPKSATGGSLLYLYREHVDKDLKIPGDTKFIRPPNLVKRAQVPSLLMEELRLTLQQHAPHVFIHSTPMSHTVLVNLYIKFVLDETVSPGLLVRGFHYSLLRESAS